MLRVLVAGVKGEAADAEPVIAAIRDTLASNALDPAFKGEALTFRDWNQQMRQPVLLVSPRVLVSVSPQPGFLHQRTPLDTLGFDEPESTCDLG